MRRGREEKRQWGGVYICQGPTHVHAHRNAALQCDEAPALKRYTFSATSSWQAGGWSAYSTVPCQALLAMLWHTDEV